MGKNDYILTIDQGTSSTKVILYDTYGKKKAEATHSIPLIESISNFIEQKPEDILLSIQNGIRDVIDSTLIDPKDVLAVAIDNQGETIIPFRKNDLSPLYNTISWQDGRGEKSIQQLKKNAELDAYVKNKTGLFSSSYFSASKMEWLVQNNSEIKKELDNDNLVMATSEVWIINKLIKKKKFQSDFTTASRTMLFDIESLQWDERLVDYFHLTMDCMPDPAPAMDNYGVTNPEVCSGINAPVLVSIVDQQSALVGHRCFKEGEAKLTLGTGGFLQVNSGSDPKNRSNLIIKSLFPQVFKKISYIYEGQIYSVGSAIEWLKRNNLVDKNSDIDLIESTDSAAAPYFIPALSGISAPFWKSEPSAAFLGMGLQTTKTDLVRSVLEAIAFRTVQIIKLIEEETGIEIKNLSIDGGVSRNMYILNTVSKLTGKRIIKSGNEDLTSLGCFFLSSLQLGLFNSYEDIMEYNLDSLVIEEPLSSSIAERFSKWENLLKIIVN